MFSRLTRNPGHYAVELTSELARRGQSLDLTDFDALRTWTTHAVETAYYCTRAKALLVRPLRDRKIDFDGNDWRGTVIKLYGLWQRLRPAEVEKRMAELREQQKGSWARTFPDEWDIDEKKLLELYKSGGPLLMNSSHDWSDLSLALRFYATEMLATVAGGGGTTIAAASGGTTVATGTSPLAGKGFFDWGGSDGLSCIFAASHGVMDIHLHEPNAANRAFGQWLASQLAFSQIHFHEHDPIGPDQPPAPPPRRFAAGLCTEVLEHVVDPPRMMRQFHALLEPGGVIFVTSSFGVPQDSHLKQNLRYAGKESEMMREAGFIPWQPPVRPPMPFLPPWGFWQRPTG